MKYLLMSSTTSLQSDKLNFLRHTNRSNSLVHTTSSVPIDAAPVNSLLLANLNGGSDHRVGLLDSPVYEDADAAAESVADMRKPKSKQSSARLSRSQSEEPVVNGNSSSSSSASPEVQVAQDTPHKEPAPEEAENTEPTPTEQ